MERCRAKFVLLRQVWGFYINLLGQPLDLRISKRDFGFWEESGMSTSSTPKRRSLRPWSRTSGWSGAGDRRVRKAALSLDVEARMYREGGLCLKRKRHALRSWRLATSPGRCQPGPWLPRGWASRPYHPCAEGEMPTQVSGARD